MLLKSKTHGGGKSRDTVFLKVNLCFIYLDPSPCVTYLEKLLNEKPDERAESGAVFDREAYLRDVEGFDDREVRDVKKKTSTAHEHFK